MKSKMVERKYTKIYFRVFPMETMIWDHIKILDDHRTVYIRCLQELSKTKESLIPTFWSFRTDFVFYNHTQQQIYDKVISDVLENLCKNRDAIIMAYGQTGTGKTVTIGGLNQSYEDRGILLRVVPDVFNLQKNAKNHYKICIQVSFVEISRSAIVDLLQPYPNSVHSIKDIIKVKVKNEEDVLKLIFRGEGRKEFAENASYPSHLFSSICTFYITTKNLEKQSNNLSQCKLHVIDLAGNDTVGNFSCLFKNPQEIGAANLAKTQLEQFFLVLSQDIPEQIKAKFRLNPMIHYLGSSLSNSTVLRFIGHIRVSREDLLVTISMLRFGELVGKLKATKFEINDNVREVSWEKLNKLEEELKAIKMETKYNSVLMHQDLGRSLNEERFAHIQRTVNEYLQNKISELTLVNVCDVNMALEILKTMYKKFEDSKLTIKELPPSKTRKLSSASSSRNKLHTKSSHASNKTSSTDIVLKKVVEEKAEKSRSEIKTSKEKVPSLHDSSSKIRPKTSNASLTRRSITARKKSQSSASVRESRPKSKSDITLLLGEIPPEYSEAWGLYTSEKSQDYKNFVDLYRQNEISVKTIYNTYLTELNNLRNISEKVDKIKNDLLMAKLTLQFQNVKLYDENGEPIVSELEECSQKELQKSVQEQQRKQEVVLRVQAELKLYVDQCKQVKRELKESLDQFCKEKYHMPLVESALTDVASMNIEEIFDEKVIDVAEGPTDVNEKEKVASTEFETVDKKSKQFEYFKRLVEKEKRRRKLYLKKSKNWQ